MKSQDLPFVSYPIGLSAVSLLLVAVWGLVSESHAADRSEVFPGSSWKTKEPREVGLKPEKLDELARAIGGDGVVIRNGYRVKTWGRPKRRAD